MALKSLLIALGLVFAGAGLAAEPARAPAVDKIEKFHAALLDTMKKGAELGIEGRFKKIAPHVDAAFDIPAMTKFAVGPTWSGMQKTEHDALITAFRRMTIASYARNFDSFKGQKFVVEPNVEVRGADTLVKSQVVPEGEKAVNLTYRMRGEANAPKVIDVIYEYVSQVATKRSDFASTVADGGSAALVKKLDEISDNLMKGKT